jgi:hypothetical protein
MMVLILFGAILAVLSVAGLLGMTPDTHRDIVQHGNFEF